MSNKYKICLDQTCYEKMDIFYLKIVIISESNIWPTRMGRWQLVVILNERSEIQCKIRCKWEINSRGKWLTCSQWLLLEGEFYWTQLNSVVNSIFKMGIVYLQRILNSQSSISIDTPIQTIDAARNWFELSWCKLDFLNVLVFHWCFRHAR